MEDNKNKTKVDLMYDDLYEQGYLEKDRDTFNKFFYAPGEQGYKNRKALYDDLHEQGYLESPTYEDFARGIGLHAVQQSQPVVQAGTGPAAGGRQDLVESLNQYGEGLKAQSAPAAGNVANAAAPSSRGGGAGRSWSDGENVVRRPGNVAVPYTGIKKTDPVTGEQYRVYTGAAAANADTVPSELQGRDLLDENGNLISARQWQSKYGDKPHLAGAAGLWNGGDLEYGTVLDSHIQKAIDLGMKHGDHSRMSTDELKAKRQELTDRYANGFTETPESLQDAIDLNNIDYELTARHLGYKSSDDMMKNHRGEADFELNKGRLNQDDLDFYEKQGSHVHNLGDNPLYVYGWQKFTDLAKRNEELGQSMSVEDYINALMADPDIESKFYAWTLTRAKKNNRSWSSNIEEAMEDFRKALSNGENPHALLDENQQKKAVGKYYLDEIDRMEDLANAGSAEWAKGFQEWFRTHQYDHYPRNTYSAIDNSGDMYETMHNILRDSRNKINEAMLSDPNSYNPLGFMSSSVRGALDVATDINTYLGGIGDAKDAININNAAQKSLRGIPLNQGEQSLLDAVAMNVAIEQFTNKYIGTGYKAGMTTAMAMEFIVEMMISGGAAEGANVAAKALAKGGKKKLMQWLERLGVKRFVDKALKKMSEVAEKSKISKAINNGLQRIETTSAGRYIEKAASRAGTGAKTLAKGIGESTVKGGFQASTIGYGKGISDAALRMAGEQEGQVNANTGHFEHTGITPNTSKPMLQAAAESFLAQTGEWGSEHFGDTLEKFTGFLGRYVRRSGGKMVDKLHLRNVVDYVQNMKGADLYRAIQQFRKDVHYNGSFAEYLEEVANNIGNAAFVGDMNFGTGQNGVFNPWDNWETYVSCKYMSGLFGTANVATYRTPRYRARQDVKRYGDMAKRIFGGHGNDWSTIANLIQDNSEEARKQLVVDLMQSGKYSKREKQIALQYAGAVYKSMGMDLGEGKQKRSAGEQEASEAYGRGYNMANLETIAETSGVYNQLRAQMEKDYGSELMKRMDDEPGLVYNWVRAGAVSEEDAQKVLNYLNAKMAYDGAMDRLNDDDAAAKAAAESHIDDQVYTEENGGDGQIHPVTLKGRDGDHYVVSGNVVTNDEGAVDVAASDNDIVVVDSDGNRMMTTAKDIAQVGDTIDPDAAKAQAVAQISSVEAGVESGEDLDSEEGRVESTEGFEDTDLEETDTTTGTGAAQGALPVSEYNQDDLVTVEVDGKQVSGIITNGLDNDGNVTIYFDEPINGQQNWQMTPEQLNQVAVSYTSRDGETIDRSVREEESGDNGENPQEPQEPGAPVQVASEEVSGEPSDGEAIAQGTQSQVPTSGEYSAQSEEAASPSGATQQAPAQEQPQQAPTQPSLPIGEDGNADFSNATPQEAHGYIYNDPELDEDEANQAVTNKLKGAQNRLDQAQAVLDKVQAIPAPNMEDYGEDTAGYKRAKRERNEAIAQAQAAVDAAQREVDLWNGVQAQHMMSRAAANAAANREETPAAPSAPAPVSGESENNAPTPSQATPPQGQQTTESTQEPSAPQPNEGNAPVASTTPSSEEERGESAPVNETAGAAEEELTPDERIERARMEALENRAEELAESCGLPVQVARSLDDLSDRHRREVEKQHAAGKYVNGFYDPMTKQIVLFLPDIAKNGGLRRLERTFLHEGVAHGGLRALFENAQNGIQTFDELCDQVWEMMPVVTQAQMMNYIGVQKPEDMTQEKKRIAADEYMAHLAEWGVEQSVKSRIISAVKNALRKIGVKMKLSNNDIVSLLAASRRKLNEMDKVGINSAISEALDNDGEDEGEGVRMSTTAIFEGAGLEVSRDATDNEGKPTKEPLTDSKGNLVARIGDKEFSVDNPVKAEDLKPAKMGHAVKESSVLHMLIEDSKKYSGLSDAQADKIYQNYADLLNMYLYMGSAAMGGPETVTEAWEWLGDSVFRTIAANGDAQYSYSMDIIRVCKKNEAVIKAMSALQLREGRGATPSEIVELYRETHEDGYQVPCPVCYVFTRYIRNGKYASAAIKGMEKWGDHLPGGSDVWSVDQWVDALDKIQRETNPDYKPDGKNKMKGKELEKAKRFKKQLDQANNITVAYEKRVNALSYLLTTDDAIKDGTIKNKVLELTPERRASIEKELDIINEQYQHAVEIIAHQALSNWIKTHAIEEKDGKWTMREDARKPEDIDDYKRNALDLRLTSNTIVNYPAIQRLRKSGGSAAGKEISFASDNRLGEVVSGLGINKTNLSGYKNKYEEALHATGRARTKARNEARKRFKDATVYALMQTLRGGQRMWSWSDNIERLSPDIAINIMQLQLLGGAMQTYSKQLEGIKLAAQMGAYVNGSLMAKDNGYQEVADKDVEERDGKLWLKHDITDEVEEYPVGGGEPKPRKRIVAAKGSYVYQAEDGKKYVLIYDDVVGVDPFGNELHGKGKKKGLFQLNQEYDRAGNILVGMNDLHVRAAMADPAVFFIIPWHSSGANNHILNQMLNILEQTMTDRLDYTAMQEEKNMLERNKNTKELPEVNKRLRDLWEEGRQWAKQNKWKSGMEVDSNGDVITESQYMYRQLRAQIFNGNIFEAMPSEEQYRAAVDIVNNMQATMDELDARNEAWKAKSPEYKKSPEGKAEKKAIDKVKGKAKNRYNPALHTIELHDGLIDWRDSSQHEGDAEWQEQHPKRINVEEARRMIEADEFLSQVLKRVEPIGHMTNGDNTYIYPYEYWQETDEKGNPADIKDADINGKRYVEYCRRMGYKPKFSGRWGDKVTEENMNDGNFVHDPGYWKLLIDRRMYDRKGKYQWLDPVESENFEPDLVNPLKTGEEFNITQVADDKDAEDIAERVYNNMAERDGGVAKVDYSKPLDKIMDEYDASLAAGVQANVKLTDAETDALDDMEEAMEEEDSGVMFSTSPTFYSNAERAVEGIKQNKATAEQWKAMLTKAGGIKAGEDKWMGLSTWLDENKGKSLTKDEVLQFVRDNGIQMEEVNYGDIYETSGYVKLNDEYMALRNDAERIFQEANKQFADYVGEMEAKYGDDYYRQMTPQERQIYNRLSIDQELRDPNIYSNEDIAFREMVERYGDDFEMAFRATSAGLEIDDRDAASYFVQDVQAINFTRLDYTTEGLENKREIAFKVPNVEPYQVHDEVHFGPENQGKAVMWVRFGETTDADGNRVLVIDEIQSNRHQDARENGYSSSEETKAKAEEAKKEMEDFIKQMQKKYKTQYWGTKCTHEENVRYHQLSNRYEWILNSGVPAAPFEKNWHEVAMKRMLRLAAEEGFDKVAWTTGEQQAKRYNLGRMYDSIEREDNPSIDGKRFVLSGRNMDTFVVNKEGNIEDSSFSEFNGKPLSDVVGKDLAERMMNLEDGDMLEGEDLRIGGEGMKGFYDQMLPRFMDKYGKRWGVKTGTVELPNVEEAGRTMHSVDVTPEMKESVMQGQPLFSTTYSLGVPYQGTKGKIARSLMEKLPGGRRFVDLFAGGGAMTHAAMLSGKYDEYHMNDVNPIGVELFMQGLRGEWDDYNRTSMTPEEFKQIKGTPEAIPWSVLGLGRNLVKGGKPDYINRVKRLGQLKDQADKVSNSFEDYRNVEIRPGDVVYADIPYENTDTYNYGKGRKFDKKAFCDWAQAQDFPIFVSESVMPEGWVEIASESMKTINPKKNRTEKLWVQEKFAGEYEPTARNTGQEAEVDGVPAYEANNLRFSVLDPERDADLIADLDGQEYVTVYRTMAKVNGEYYPPMDSRDHDNPEKLRNPEKLGQYTQSEERPDLAYPEEYTDKKTGEKKTRWKFNLKKSNGKSVDGVAYNPYMHTSDSALNDQFSEAQDRDDLVVVECRVPVSELDPNSYHAEKALDPVGWKPWKAGPIVSKMTGKRNLLLSRWVKPVKELSWSEVADMVSKQLGDQFDVLPSNTFSKGLRAELEKRGYKFIETDNKGIIQEGPYKGVTWSDRYYDIHPEKDKRSNKKAKRAKVAEAKARNAEAVRFSTGWHGSGSEFDRFDHSHMGEGEGAQAYGWGTYITSVEGIGRSYATESAKKNPTYYWKDQKIDRASINPLSMAYDVVEREGTIKKAISLVDRFLDNPDAHENWAEVKEILKQSKKSDFTRKPARYLYEVEIPDNNGENYISWNETLPKKHRRRIANVVRELPDDLLQRDTHGPNWLRGGFEQLANTIEREQYAGKEITERLRDAIGNSRAVSEVFSKAGFVGTEYPAQYLSGGRKDGAKNYVIYNEDDIEIKDRIRFSTSAAVAALKDDERVYNRMLGKVFSGVSNETRRGIVGDAMENRGYDFGAATEAWLMGLTDDEAFAQVPQEDWRAVKNALGNALRENGVEGTMTDNEARYVLWKAGQIEDGVFSLAEDVVMRDRLLPGKSGVRFSTSPAEQIYSDNFKNWFGDWENDPENASKVVDKDGRPLVVYNANAIAEEEWGYGEEDIEPMQLPIRIFNREYASRGFWFSNSNDFARKWIEDWMGFDPKRVSAVYLDIKNPLIIDAKHKLWTDIDGRSTDEWAQYAEENGYDGLIIRNVVEGDSEYTQTEVDDYVVFSPTQIKSATENNGDFSRSNPDIRFSVTPRDRAIARDQYERWMKSGRMQWLESMQDSMLGLKKLMQAIMGNAWTKVEDVAMYENPYIAENLMSSVTAAQQQAFYTEFMKPLLKEVSKLCKGGKKAREKAREDLTNYLMAKHGLERNQVLADRDAQETAQAGGDYQEAYQENRERDYSGLTALTGEDDVHAAEAKAQQMVDDYESQHDTTELWNKINAATQVTLEKQYKSGMLSYAEYQRISDMFEYYVPLRGWEETTSDQVYGYLTSKAGPFLGGGIVKRAEGRTSKADDPIATIAQMGDDSIRTGNRNLMKQRFLNFVQNHPSDAVSVSDLWLKYDDVTDEWVPVFADIDPNDSPEVVEQKLQAFEQQMQQLASQEPTKYKHGREAANIPYRVIPGMEKEHQVLVKRNGQTWVLTINGNPRAAQALNGLTNPDVPMEGAWASMIKGAEWVNRTLSALYTTLSPAFIVSNFLRDTGYSNTMVWVRESPNYALRFNKNYLKLNPGTLRWLLGKWEEGTLDESKPLQKHFKEFMLNGGETGFAMVQDLEKYKKNMLNEVKGMNSRNFVRKGMKVLGSQYELLGRSIENCARFAAYMTSREMGRSAERAAYDAKEISVNFNKKGSGGKSLGKVGQTKTGNVGAFISGMARSLYTFWNAGVQGMTNAGRAVKRHPVKAALMGAGPLYAAGFLAPILAQMMGAGGDGDDDKNAYYNLPEYVRRSNLCIWLGDAWLTIPLPIEFRSIYGLGELTYGVISGNERYTDEELAMQVAGQFSQLLPIDMLEGGGGFHPFIPTLFKPLVEAEQNKSWSGLPIYRKSEWNKDDPEYTKAFSNANEWIVSGAEWLNAMTGGDEFKKGWIDLNPAKIEYMLKGYLGGIYTTIDEVRRAAETALGKRDFEWRNIPLANRVIKQGDERTESKKLRDEYFKYKDDYENTKHLINKYKNAENTDLFDYAKKLDLLNNSKEYGRYLIFEKYATMLEAYQKAKKGASGEVLKKIEEDEKALMRQLVDEMHAFEDGKITVGNRPKLSKKDRSEDYGYMYNKLRTYVDINEDALLDSALKRAKAADDKGLVAALNSIKRSISEMKKGLGRGKDEEVMNSIRQMRNSVLQSFGVIGGGEEEPPEVEEQWQEEPQEDWGDEGNADFDEPIEPYPDDEDDEYDY